MMSGMTIDTTLGRKQRVMTAPVEIFPAIQSMMVVTSPIGDHAPPALAARMIMPPKNQRSFWSVINLRSKAIITIAVVRLSSRADSRKVRNESAHSSLTLLLVLMWSVMMLNPP